ncbi:MAG: hypothetical protein J7L53_01880 [Deltaproteobacteria bacterium]|nr:hypothetical protein [Deltaproteobacteria bacterium]
MIWTLKVELLFGIYAEAECIRIIEINSSSILEDLHFAIQDAVGFDNDHLYEFYISKTERSRDRIRFDDENRGIYNVTLESLYPLEKGKKLYYLFDYGDNWLFKIIKSRKKPTEPIKGLDYPRVVESIGDNPEQYPIYDE